MPSFSERAASVADGILQVLAELPHEVGFDHELVVFELNGRTVQPLDGAVYLVLGPIEGAVDVATDPSAFEWTGSAAGDETGPVTRLGDVDGNGLNDLVIGARFSDLGGPDSGTAYVILCGTAP